MGHLFLTAWLELWKLRNEERHGQDQVQQEALKRQTIMADLTELYRMKHSVCPADRIIFYDNIAEHLQHHPNLSQLEEWIILYRDAIRSSVKTAKQLGIQHTRTLLDYPMFNPAAPPGPTLSPRYITQRTTGKYHTSIRNGKLLQHEISASISPILHPTIHHNPIHYPQSPLHFPFP